MNSKLKTEPEHPNALVVTIPGNNGPAAPTGAVYNGSMDFQIAPKRPAVFIFVSEDGTISGWNPAVNSTKAVLKVPQTNSVFKGAATATVGSTLYLYVRMWPPIPRTTQMAHQRLLVRRLP